jgi:ShK domain-like
VVRNGCKSCQSQRKVATQNQNEIRNGMVMVRMKPGKVPSLAFVVAATTWVVVLRMMGMSLGVSDNITFVAAVAAAESPLEIPRDGTTTSAAASIDGDSSCRNNAVVATGDEDQEERFLPGNAGGGAGGENFRIDSAHLEDEELEDDEEEDYEVVMGVASNDDDDDEFAENDCQDDHGTCGSWADLGECSANPNWMTVHCRKSCGLCVDDEERKM